MKSLDNLSIRQRVHLIVSLAGTGLLLVFVVTVGLGARSTRLLSQIEDGYYPSARGSQEILARLEKIQRVLQDAVAAAETGDLVLAEPHYRAVLTTLARARANPIEDRAEIESLRTEFEAYYRYALKTAPSMIGERTGVEASNDLAQLAERYRNLSRRLAKRVQRDEQAVAAAIEALRSTHRLSIILIIAIGMAATGAAGFVAMLLVRSITQPLAQAVETADRLSRGDMTAAIVELARGDEIGQLLGSMQGMVGSLRRLVGSIQQTSEQLTAAANEVSSSADQMTRGVESQSAATEETSATLVEMAAQIDHIAQSSQVLASSVDETSSSIHELATTIEQVARNADQLLQSAVDTSSTIEEMTASIRAVAEKTRVVDDVGKEAARIASEGGAQLGDAMAEIGTQMRSVGKVLRVIEDISDQTTLLALNAAIEAARAGEAGRGFAVVADEVRRLSERSVQSAREVASIVESIQTETTRAIDLSRSVMEKIVTSTSRTSLLVADVYRATDEQSNGATMILRTTINMQSITREVAMAAKEQSAASREIMKSVAAMNQMTAQVAGATDEQKRAGDVVVRSVEQITHVAHANAASTSQLTNATATLRSEATRLQQLASQFVM